MAAPLLQVEGVDVRLSTFENAKINIADGGLRVSLQNYTGEIFFVTQESTSSLIECQRNKRKAVDVPCSTPMRGEDPAAYPTVKKAASTSEVPSSPQVEADDQQSHENQDSDITTHPKLAKSGGLVVLSDEETGEGVFHYLGGGKAAKAGYVSVSSSNYDPTKKKPDDLVAGRKGGHGCMAMPRSDDGMIFFEFALREDMELCLGGYCLRNGSRDMGTFLKQWVFEIYHAGKWIVVAEEDTDALDGCKQSPEFFKVHVSHLQAEMYTQRVRIRLVGDPDLDRHKLWLASVELFGTLRLAKTA